MRLAIFTLLFSFAYATNTQSCKLCHPIIYNEFENSMHKKSTIKDDKLFRALANEYKDIKECNSCHSPLNQKSGVDCISCHKIKDIKEHPKANINIYESKKRLFYSAQEGMENKRVEYKKKSYLFGLITKVEGSPYHDIDYTKEIFYNGKVCMGCHSHKVNSNGFEVCRTSSKGVRKDSNNCITCHMPKINGSATNIRVSKTHAYHGFAGVFNSPSLLGKYIKLNYKKTKPGFLIEIQNLAPHNLTLHPLRVLELRVKIKRDNKITPLPTKRFEKIIGKDNIPSLPWEANRVLKDSSIKANEKRDIKFDFNIEPNDEIEATLGYFIVKPNILEKLKIEDKKLKKFVIIKQQYFKVK